MSTGVTQESADPSEVDLAVIGALEVNPRAEWRAVGEALDLAPTTVARRWSALSADGDAWVTVAPGHTFVADAGCAFLFIAVDPRELEQAIASLSVHPVFATISRITGEFDLMIDCFAESLSSLPDAVSAGLVAVQGIQRKELLVTTQVLRHGAEWRSGAIARDQALSLRPEDRKAPAGRRRVEARLVDALTRDGRMTWEQLGLELGLSSQTARRHTNALLDRGVATLRCDRARRFDAAHREASLAVSVPAPRLAEAARFVAEQRSCRLSAEVIGSFNLLATLWVRDLSELQRVEAELVLRIPDAVVHHRTLSTRTDKRLGHLLDAEGRSVGAVPIEFPSL